ncbi:helix-turn-helix domain-containing protein [Devosia oryziradicis]|uniref:Helix-turn-helix domain-containing protein n=1 Tax=Devosia oryziradicis TaxID=2801335 RepID=A0ABX7BWX1_9HYPH|nr:helix-turn-helix domain-containing protein [Devosia oryziradicis]QQR36451.1 helix-turn-helix domain-containing protein [Devosia oryziradicis]
MDSILNAAAQALATGDVLGALNRVALRDDPGALALRGTAMAQLGDLPRARQLLAQAARGFGRHETVARARCVLAEAEIALVSRDLTWPEGRLEAARQVLSQRGDAANAAHAGIIAARRDLLLGHLDGASQYLAALSPRALPPPLLAGYWLVSAGIDIRRVRVASARRALQQAEEAARQSGQPGLLAETEAARRSLDGPAARLRRQGVETAVSLDAVEALFGSETVVCDATSNALRQAGLAVSLSRRPVLFALLRVLAEAWPGDASREHLLARAFHARQADESHRARLRVEMTRLRQLIGSIADVSATPSGFRLVPRAGDVAVLALPLDDQHAAVMALLADGELWSSSALAMVLDSSPRSIQRALRALQEAGKAQAVGRGRAQRWALLTLPGFPTTLLLPNAGRV